VKLRILLAIQVVCCAWFTFRAAHGDVWAAIAAIAFAVSALSVSVSVRRKTAR
jgi:hypothetical protein